MSRLDENIALTELINKTLNIFSAKTVRESINTTILLDISRSLAVIADALSERGNDDPEV